MTEWNAEIGRIVTLARRLLMKAGGNATVTKHLRAEIARLRFYESALIYGWRDSDIDLTEMKARLQALSNAMGIRDV
jgi:hypothetical protein